MAQKFILTAQLRLAAPTNVAAIVSSINAGLRGINVNVKINTSGVNQQLNTINKTLNSTSKAAKTAANDMERFGEQAATAIRRYGAFTLATTAFIKLTNAIAGGIDDAIKFDREMVRLAQVTGNTLGGVKELGDEVTRLAKTYGVASTEILEASVTLAQAGISAKNVKTILESIAKTGVSATFGNMKNTTEAVIAAMQQFNLKASEVEDTLSSINSVSAKFAVEASDITTAIVRTGGAFQAAGGNIKEFQALFTSVRQTTRESAETIATGFRTIFTRLQRTRTQNFLQSIGIDLKDVQGQFVGPYEAVRRLSAALKDLRSTDPRFAQIIEELGGFRQISKVIPLITKFDVAQQALNVAMRSGSSLTKDAETAQQALSVQITKVREEFLALVRNVSNNSAFRGFIDLTLKLSSSLIKLADTLTPIVPLLAAVGAVKIGAGFTSFATGFGRKFADGGRVQKFASGGLVPGHGSGDTVPAALTPGEFVIRKDAVKAIGADNLHQVNKYGFGGVVKLDKAIGTKVYALRDTDGTEIPVTKKVLEKIFGLTSSDKNSADLLKKVNSRVGNLNEFESTAYDNLINEHFGGLDSDLISKKALRKENRLKNNGLNITQSKSLPSIEITGLPDLVTAEKALNGQEQDIDFSSTIGQLIARGRPNKAVKQKLLASVDGTSNIDKAKVTFQSKIKTHGLNLELGDRFHGAAEKGIVSIVNGIVNDSGIKNMGGHKLNAHELLEESAVQSVKGSMLEGIVRQISGVAVDQQRQNNTIDFGSIPDGIFQGKIARDAEAKVSINNTNLLSTVVKGLKNNAKISKITRDSGQKELPLEPQKAAIGGFIKKFANGGHASGTDTVPAMLTPGEFVINKSSANKLGASTLNKLNKADKFANGGFVKGYAGGGIVGGIASNPLALGLIASSVQGFIGQLSGGNKELEKLTSILTGVVFQFGIFKTLVEGAKGSFQSLHNIPLNDTRNREHFETELAPIYEARKDAHTRRTNANTQLSDSRKAKRISRFNEAQDLAHQSATDAQFNTGGRRLSRGIGIGGALLAGVGSIAGDHLSSTANAGIANGKDHTVQAGIGGGLAGAGQGAAIGAIFGPLGIAVGGVTGALIGYTTSISSARKELDRVKFAKQVEEFGKLIDLVSSGRRSIGESKGSIISGVSEQLHRFSSASPEEAKNIKANFSNDSAKIDQIIQTIAKDADSFEALQKSTKNLLVDFSILTDLPFDVLRDQITKQIDAQKKATAFAKTSNKQHEQEVRAALSLTAMVEAVNRVSTEFDKFDTSLNSASAFLDGHGAAGTSKDISSLLEKAAKGHLGDPSELIRGVRGITGSFGAAGTEQTTRLEESTKLLAQLPELLLQARDKTGLGVDGGKFEAVLAKILGPQGRGFSKSAVDSVIGGVRGVIGPADSDDKIIDDIKNNLEHTSQEVGKSLQVTINAFKEFAPVFKQQADRINKALEVYEKALEKQSDYTQAQIGRNQGHKNFLAAAYGKTRGHEDITNDQLERVAAFSGGVTDVTALAAQLKLAKSNSQKFGSIADNATAPEKILENRTLQTEENNKIKETTKALHELANVSENLTEIQKELGHAEEARKFNNDVLKTAVFGTRAAKVAQNRTISAAAQASRFGIDTVQNKDKESVLRFFQGLGKHGKFGGISGEDHIKNIENNSAFGQQFKALFGKDALRPVQEEGQGKAAQDLLKAAGLLTQGANTVSQVLKDEAKNTGLAITSAISDQNKAFLSELRIVFLDRQIADKEREKRGVQSDFNDINKQTQTAVGLKKNFGIDKDNVASFKGAKELAEARINLRKREDLLNVSGDDGKTLGNSSNFKGNEGQTIEASALRFAQQNHFRVNSDELNTELAKVQTSEIDSSASAAAARAGGSGTPIYKKRSNNAIRTDRIEAARRVLGASFNSARRESDNALISNGQDLSKTGSGRKLLAQQNSLSTTKADLALKQLNKDLEALGNESVTTLTNKLSALRDKIQDINNYQDELVQQRGPAPAITSPEVKFATGGGVPGVGNTDTIPAMLTPGEFVMRKSAVASIGLDNLHAMNNGYNTGGLVKFFADGGEVDGVTPAMKRQAQRNITKMRADEFQEEIKDLPKIGHKEITQQALDRFGPFADKPDKKRLAKELQLAQSVKKSDTEGRFADEMFAGKAEARKTLDASNKKALGSRGTIIPQFARDAAKKVLDDAKSSNPRIKFSHPENDPNYAVEQAQDLRARAKIAQANLDKKHQDDGFFGPIYNSDEQRIIKEGKRLENRDTARAGIKNLAEQKRIKFEAMKKQTDDFFSADKLKIKLVSAPPKSQDILDDEKKSLASTRSVFLQRKYGDGIVRSHDGTKLDRFDLENNSNIAAAKRKAIRDVKTTHLETFHQARKDKIETIKKRKEELRSKSKKHFNNGGEVQYYSGGGAVGGGNRSGGGKGITGIKELGMVVQKFSTIINDFTKRLTQFKDMSITLKATHKVDVTFNGAEAFKSMGAQFEKMAVAETKKAINSMLETKFPNVGKME